MVRTPDRQCPTATARRVRLTARERPDGMFEVRHSSLEGKVGRGDLAPITLCLTREEFRDWLVQVPDAEITIERNRVT